MGAIVVDLYSQKNLHALTTLLIGYVNLSTKIHHQHIYRSYAILRMYIYIYIHVPCTYVNICTSTYVLPSKHTNIYIYTYVTYKYEFHIYTVHVTLHVTIM